MSLSPTRLTAIMSQVLQLLAELPDDVRLVYDTLEGETGFFEALDSYAEAALADAKLVEMGEERVRRLKARSERNRKVVLRMLEIAGMTKTERPLYTATVSYRSKPIVTDTSAVPAKFMRQSADMHAIAKELKTGRVPGVEQSNPSPVLTLRTT